MVALPDDRPPAVLHVVRGLGPHRVDREIGRAGDRDPGRERRSRADERVGLPLVEIVADIPWGPGGSRRRCRRIRETRAPARCVGRKLVRTTAEGRMNSARAAASLADPPGISPLVLESDLDLLAGSEDSARRGEDVEVRPVVGRNRLAVQRPGELLPVRAAGQQDLVERLLAVVDQLVRAPRRGSGLARERGRGRARRG